MRAASVIRFIVFGALGFGIGGTLSGLLGVFGLPLALLLGRAVGGAGLGLALKDCRRAVILALLGALGLTVGLLAVLIAGASFNYAAAPIATIVGAMVGASLGAAFLDWRTILALAVAGAGGFGVGVPAGDFLWESFLFPMGVWEGVSITIAGLVGGEFLGAALGYLENRKLNEERSPRVR